VKELGVGGASVGDRGFGGMRGRRRPGRDDTSMLNIGKERTVEIEGPVSSRRNLTVFSSEPRI